MKSMLKTWFEGLSAREQQISVFGGLALLLFLLYSLLLEPLQDSRAKLKQSTDRQFKELQWMQQQVARVLRSKNQPSPGQAGKKLPVSQVVDRTVARYKLRRTRYQPSPGGGVQLWFEDVVFDDVLLWLGQLDNEYGITASNLAINRQKTPGLVDLRVTLKDRSK